MKKRISSLLATMVLALFLCIPALATGFDEAGLYFVTDEAGLLSDQECLELERRAEEISLKYKCGVYIILLDDFTAYTYDETIYEAAKTLYQEYRLGYGEEKSGELLLLSMAERDYTLIAYGYGNTAFTDYGKDKLSEVFLDDFGDDNWYSGLSDYLDKSESMLQSAREGHPLDVDSNPPDRSGRNRYLSAGGLRGSLCDRCGAVESPDEVRVCQDGGQRLPHRRERGDHRPGGSLYPYHRDTAENRDRLRQRGHHRRQRWFLRKER